MVLVLTSTAPIKSNSEVSERGMKNQMFSDFATRKQKEINLHSVKLNKQ